MAKGNEPVIVDVKMDYTKKMLLTKGVGETNLTRFPLKEKVLFIVSAVKRNLLGRLKLKIR